MSALLFMLERDDIELRRRKRRRIRDDFRIYTIPDREFMNTYRISKPMFEELYQDIVPLLPARRRTAAVDPASKILIALNLYARGSYQGAVGLSGDTPASQPTVSRCLNEVTEALNSPQILNKYIRFPQNAQERNIIKQRFYEYYRFPGVVGCIDCTHVAIVRPAQFEERFFNRKHYHSLNVQVICDADNCILSVDASYGGATHDAFIWGQHEIKAHLQRLVMTERVYLLGDSGYPVREYMLTPIDNAQERTPEGHYNFIQKRTRSTVERTFGILKGRWRCLLAARQLHYTPEKAGKIVLACCVLHNLCIRGGIEVPELTDEEQRQELLMQPNAIPLQNVIQLSREGRRVRNQIVNLLNR